MQKGVGRTAHGPGMVFWLSLVTLALAQGPSSARAGRAGSLPWQALVRPATPAEQARGLVYSTFVDESELGAANPFGFTNETSAATCAGGCHVQQLDDWENATDSDLTAVPIWDSLDESGKLDPYNTLEAGSMHSLAWKDFEFQQVYHDQSDPNKANCQRCHVPDTASNARSVIGVYAPNTRSLHAANFTEGITCVSCHLDGSGQIVGDLEFPASDSGHAVVASPLFNGVDVCASCHNDPLYGSLTKTADEYRAQAQNSGKTCVSCHMGSGDGLNHFFAGGHSPARREAALALTIPTSATTAGFTIQVKNVGAGHNVPTGERFRAFKVSLTLSNNQGTVYTRDYQITKPVSTPTMQEVIDYNQIEPIAAGQTVNLTYDRLNAGIYQLRVDLTYYQIKDATLELLPTHRREHVEPFGVAPVRTWSQTLTIRKS